MPRCPPFVKDIFRGIMSKHLILLVHGIGEQVAGETVDEFVGAAVEELDLERRIDGGKLMLSEPDLAAERDNKSMPDPVKRHKVGQLDLFPCHTRRVRTKAGDEMMFAEVHWSDISRAPVGVLATLFDMLRLILGLGYLALDNVQNNVNFRRSPIPLLVWLFVFVFYALIAPINLLLASGSLFLLVDPYIIEIGREQGGLPAGYILALFGLIVVVAALFLQRGALTCLTRNFWTAFGIMGLVTLAVAICSLVFPGPSIDANAPMAGCRLWHGPTNHDILTTHPYVNCFVASVVAALNLFWLTAVVLLILMTVWLVLLSLWAGLRIVFRRMDMADAVMVKQLGNRESIYLAICAGMLVFWMIFSVAFWSLLIRFVQELTYVPKSVVSSDFTLRQILAEHRQPILLAEIFEVHFASATATLSYGFLAFVSLVIATGIVAVWRSAKKAHLMSTPSARKWLGRLILNPVLNFVLFVVSLLIMLGTVHAAYNWWVPDYCGNGSSYLTCWLDENVAVIGRFALGGAAALGFAFYYFWDFVSAALGVGRDIVVYSTRSRWANPNVENSRSRYLFRDRIEARFNKVYTTLVKAEEPDTVCIVSHSQGTVVAVRALSETTAVGNEKTMLITMGSPVTHIYGQYFRKFLPTREIMENRLECWFNICRRDDFVGTDIDKDTYTVINRDVWPAGHTGYWSDTNVWLHFRGILQTKKYSPIEAGLK